jgi:hypothetical protein
MYIRFRLHDYIIYLNMYNREGGGGLCNLFTSRGVFLACADADVKTSKSPVKTTLKLVESFCVL